MIIDASCHISFSSEVALPVILMLRPRSGWAQFIMREEYSITPPIPLVEYTDSLGNLCQRIVAGPGEFSVSCSCRADTADAIDVDPTARFVPGQELPDSVMPFLLPSRYCQSDMLCQLSSSIIDPTHTGYQQVESIRRWIHDSVKYEYGHSNASTSALDTSNSRIGVCRDFTHLGIALTRSLNIPARMVVGYLHRLEPMDLHAWFEAYVGGRWFVFDGTQSEPRGNRIAIAYGRDAADVAMVTQFGALQLKSMKVQVSEASV